MKDDLAKNSRRLALFPLKVWRFFITNLTWYTNTQRSCSSRYTVNASGKVHRQWKSVGLELQFRCRRELYRRLAIKKLQRPFSQCCCLRCWSSAKLRNCELYVSHSIFRILNARVIRVTDPHYYQRHSNTTNEGCQRPKNIPNIFGWYCDRLIYRHRFPRYSVINSVGYDSCAANYPRNSSRKSSRSATTSASISSNRQ